MSIVLHLAEAVGCWLANAHGHPWLPMPAAHGSTTPGQAVVYNLSCRRQGSLAHVGIEERTVVLGASCSYHLSYLAAPQHISFENLLCARHYSKNWGYDNSQNRQKFSPSYLRREADILVLLFLPEYVGLMHSILNFKNPAHRSYLISSMKSSLFIPNSITPHPVFLLPLLCKPCIWHKSDMALYYLCASSYLPNIM